MNKGITISESRYYDQGVIDAKDAIVRNLDDKIRREMATAADKSGSSDSRFLAPIRLNLLLSLQDELNTVCINVYKPNNV